MIIKYSFGILSLFLGLNTSFAQDPDLHPAIEYIKSNNVKITYLGDEGGVDAYLGESLDGSNKTQIFYALQNSPYVVAGTLMRADGKNITNFQIARLYNESPKERFDQYVDPNPKNLEIAALFIEEVEKTSWFLVGDKNAPTTLYMIADPNCIYCHKLWHLLLPYLERREISIKVILVGFLSNSKDKATSILNSENPLDSWLSITKTEVDVPLIKINYDQNSNIFPLKENHHFAEEFHISTIPFLAYQAINGEMQLHIGIPENIDEFLSRKKPIEKDVF